MHPSGPQPPAPPPPIPPPAGSTPPAAVVPPLTVSPIARAGTALWRLAVAGCAFFGVYEVAYDPVFGWTDLWFLSQSGSLVTAICYALFALVIIFPGALKVEGFIAWFRGALASMMLLICVASIFILGGGDLDQTGFLFEHLITPLVVAADLVFVGRAQLRAKGWQPVTWISLPLTYLILANVAGETTRLYGGILDPSNEQFLVYISMFLVVAVVFGYLLFGLVKIRAVIHRANNPAPPTGPGPMPPQHQLPQQQYGAPPRPQGQYGAPQARAPQFPPAPR